MDDLITTEQVLEMGKRWVLDRMPLPEVLSYYEPQDVLLRFKPEERVMGLKPQDVLPHFKPQDVLPHFNPDEIRAYLKRLEEGQQ